jgi:hypothetical protein
MSLVQSPPDADLSGFVHVNLFSNEVTKSFAKDYTSSLKQIKLKDVNGANDFINNNQDLTPYAREKCHWFVGSYLDGSITKRVSIDKDIRIYTLLSYTPKYLKRYLTIKYQLDICNSHPLLYSYFIIQKYSIPNNLILSISNLKYPSNPISYYQYDIKNFNTLLENNEISFEEINGLRIDHLFYIFLTFHGLFWEAIMQQDEFKEIPRHIIKKEMFKEVFYSKSLGHYKRTYAERFQELFPNVYGMILERRKESKNQGRIHLAHDMMSLESEIIQRILKRIYALGFQAVNIHDAIVIPDSKRNVTLKPEIIQGLIEEEYREYGLMASTKMDVFKTEK